MSQTQLNHDCPAFKKIINATEEHAKDVGSWEFAYGDLESLLAVAWQIMTPSQKLLFLDSPDLENVLETGDPDTTPDDLKQIIQASAERPMASIADIDMTAHFSYEVPGDCPEWEWIEKHASMTHKDNGKSGIWDHLLNLSTIGEVNGIATSIITTQAAPALLSKLILDAEKAGASFVLFHQGT